MKHQVAVAVRAPERLLTARAEDIACVTAAVQQEHGLLASFEGGGQFLFQAAREQVKAATRALLDAHVDQFHLRERQAGHAARQPDALVVPQPLAVVPGLQRRRGRA